MRLHCFIERPIASRDGWWHDCQWLLQSYLILAIANVYFFVRIECDSARTTCDDDKRGWETLRQKRFCIHRVCMHSSNNNNYIVFSGYNSASHYLSSFSESYRTMMMRSMIRNFRARTLTKRNLKFPFLHHTTGVRLEQRLDRSMRSFSSSPQIQLSVNEWRNHPESFLFFSRRVSNDYGDHSSGFLIETSQTVCVFMQWLCGQNIWPDDGDRPTQKGLMNECLLCGWEKSGATDSIDVEITISFLHHFYILTTFNEFIMIMQCASGKSCFHFQGHLAAKSGASEGVVF